MTHIQQRKKPVVRAFTKRLVGLPPDEPVAMPTQETATILPVTITDALGLLESDRKKKDAERKRNKRKQNREQLTAIREALKTPVADILATQKHEKAVAEFIAPQSHSVQTTNFGLNNKLEQIAAAIGRSDMLRGDETDPSTWPVNDRREVKPAGTSQDQEDGQSFVVKETTPLEYGQALLDLSHGMFVPSTDPELFVCRLCRETVSNREKHIETTHGESPDKFGNMIAWQIRQYAERRKRFDRTRKAA